MRERPKQSKINDHTEFDVGLVRRTLQLKRHGHGLKAGVMFNFNLINQENLKPEEAETTGHLPIKPYK